MSYTPLVKSIQNRTKEQQAADAARKNQEDKYRAEVKLELIKKCDVKKAKEYYDLIKGQPFYDFTFYWRALDTLLNDVNGKKQNIEAIEEIVEFLKAE